MSNVLGNMPPVFGSGYRGVVPAPTAADVSAQNILRADGTWAAGPSGTLPSQTSNSGKVLTTDGTNASWASTINALSIPGLTNGSGGPNAWSTLSARAPRQGLVFDGTAGATVTVPSIGTGDFTIAAWAKSDNSVDYQTIIGGGSNSLSFRTVNGGGVTRLLFSLTEVADAPQSTVTVPPNKWNLLTLRRNGTNVYYGVNGIEDAAITNAGDFPQPFTYIGRQVTGTIWKGELVPYVYNRALSASEVVALYEAGAPAGADYNAASNTSLITGDNSTFASDTGYWTKSSATIGSGVCTLSAGGYIYKSSFYSGVGKRYRLVVTINSIVSGNLKVNTGNDAVNITGATAPGTYTFEYSVESPGTAPLAIAATTGQIVIDNVLIYPVGLLLAPDAYQAGGGLSWYDTSGNSATITLPSSGVSWNVPSSQKTASGWTFGGNVEITTAAKTFFQSSSQSKFGDASGIITSASGVDTAIGYYSGGNLLFGHTSGSEKGRFTSSGNLLLGNTVNATGLLQLGTTGSTTSAGGIGFGTDTFLYRIATGVIGLAPSSGGDAGLRLYTTAGVQRTQLVYSGSDTYFDASGAINLRTNGGTTALTLDSSQNANIAKKLAINGAALTYDLNVRASTSNLGNTVFRFEQNNGTEILAIRDNGTAIFAGDIRIGNTVNSVSPTSPNRTITMVIGGTTYYIAAKTTND